MRKARASLITSLLIGLAAVATAGVSTYAWFRANANVTIVANSSSTTITVTKPDDYALYAYRGNKSYDYDGSGASRLSAPTGTFSNDFYLIDTTAKNADLMNLTGMCPGESYTFCLTASDLSNGDPVSLFLKSLISNDIIKQGGAHHRYRHGSSAVDINVGWAINLYSWASSSNTGYATHITSNAGLTDLFDYSYDPSFNTTTNPDPLSDTGTGDDHVMDFSENPISIYDGTATGSSIYVFYRIEFENTNSSLYQEVSSSGSKILPSTDTSNVDRYFASYDSAIGDYFVTGSFNNNATNGNTNSLYKIDNNHYQIRGLSLAANDNLRVCTLNGANYFTDQSTWSGCGFTLSDGKLVITTAGTYTVDFYVSPLNNNYIVITQSNDTYPLDYDSNCYQGLSFAIKNIEFNF